MPSNVPKPWNKIPLTVIGAAALQNVITCVSVVILTNSAYRIDDADKAAIVVDIVNIWTSQRHNCYIEH